MSVIRCVYYPLNGEPKQPPWPASDQHPEAVRYLVGLYYVDAIGGAPTPAEVAAVVSAIPVDLSDLANLERVVKAQALLLRQYANLLKQEMRGLALLLVNKGHITSQEAAGLLAFDGSGSGDQKTVADLKEDFAVVYAGLVGSPQQL